ncbi:hypothetical protein V6767_03755 [Martelella sp. FLE1502]
MRRLNKNGEKIKPCAQSRAYMEILWISSFQTATSSSPDHQSPVSRVCAIDCAVVNAQSIARKSKITKIDRYFCCQREFDKAVEGNTPLF